MQSERGDAVAIEMEEEEAEATPKFPAEKRKAFLALGLFLGAAICNDGVLAFIHERVPASPPLPDLVFDHTPHFPLTLAISEYLLLSGLVAMISTCVLHQHRWILFRRFFFITSLLYYGRSFCMLTTQLPVSDTSFSYYCSPKLNMTDFTTWIWRTTTLLSGGGLTINGMETFCGDYIYSGHTVILVMCYVMVKEYSPRKCWLLHWLLWFIAIAGVACLLLSRFHYTIDVVLAYYFTTRLFWTYHTMANFIVLREPTHTNHLSRVCWHGLFRFFESHATGPVPKAFEWPLPWPAYFRRHNQTRLRKGRS